MACYNNTYKIKTSCIGDMRNQIAIYTRNLVAPEINDVNYDENFILFKNVWARIDNLESEYIFDGTNTIQSPTHRFVIRYLPGLEETYWIKFRGQNYDISNITNFQDRKRFTQIDCVIRGDDQKEVNKS